MKRREFIALAGIAITSPFEAWALQIKKPVIGFLHQGSAEANARFVAAFREGLAQMGFSEDRNVVIEYRWADHHYDRLPALAADLLTQNVVVIVAALLPAARAAKAATTKTPIVFVSGSDPTSSGLVTSLSWPGGNITGVVNFAGELGAKRLELLRELKPEATAIGMLINPTNPNSDLNVRNVGAAARAFSLKFLLAKAANDRELEPAVGSLVQQGAEICLISPDTLFSDQSEQMVALAARYRLPAVYYQDEFARVGGLVSYGPHLADFYKQAGLYVGRILKGEKPADLPVLQPTKVELIINLKTAKALGLTIPLPLLSRADEVIE